jgi:DNA repair protein RecN (Recombination protein N)
MLHSLYIQNVVLIDKMHITFSDGLCVLTGETGAGKSILLDALNLAMGERAQTSFIRPGCEQATVAAVFKLSATHPVRILLAEQGVETTSDLFLRRVVIADGKSRAFINDQPVSVGLLKQLATDLIEIHDQFDQLLTPSSHLRVLDQSAQLVKHKQQVREAFQALKASEHALEQAREQSTKHSMHILFLQQTVQEFSDVSPKLHEEEDLVGRRQLISHAQKIREAVESILKNLRGGERGVQGSLHQSLRILEKLKSIIPDKTEAITQALERAIIEVTDAETDLLRLLLPQEIEEPSLEQIEERLYRLRLLARKHGCMVDELPALWTKFNAEYTQIQQGDQDYAKLEETHEQAKLHFLDLAKVLSSARKQAAHQLKQEVEHELKQLKLERAQFDVQFKELSPPSWSTDGIDEVEFVVQTNPGYPFGGIAKIASGGERSRLMLALKAVLARVNQASIIVFDEIDHAVGGAVAAAIGERLARLGKGQQVLAITHSPQVAAYAQSHFVIVKYMQQGEVKTSVQLLSNDDRRSEIARMLSANHITDAARAAADSLLKVSHR